MGEHLISWKPLRFASWFPTFISCSPNLPHVYIRLCKHTNHFTFLQYLSFSYGSFSWSRVNVYFWFSGVGEKMKGDGSKTKLYIGQLQNGKYRIKKSWKVIDQVLHFDLYCIESIRFQSILRQIVSVCHDTCYMCDIVVACHMTLWHHDMLLWQ